MQDQKLDKIQSDVSEIKTHLAVYNEQLKVHMKRSDALEKIVQILQKRVLMVDGGLKLLGLLAALAAIVEAYLKVVK